MIKEKGRKGGYHQFDIESKEWVKQERLLNKDEINSFLEISLRAQGCPMPLNIDIFDGLKCPFSCIYCIIGDSLISTPKGKKKIKDLKINEEVLTFNEKTKQIELDNIQKVMNRENEIYLLDIDGIQLEVTGEHPIYTKRGWIKVFELTEQDEILCLEDSP